MTSPKPSEFPALSRIFAGYLHEDFIAEHGTADAALRAFHDEASLAERKRFSREVEKFVERTAGLTSEDLLALMSRMGSRWAPASRDVLVKTLRTAAGKPRG